MCPRPGLGHVPRAAAASPAANVGAFVVGVCPETCRWPDAAAITSRQVAASKEAERQTHQTAAEAAVAQARAYVREVKLSEARAAHGTAVVEYQLARCLIVCGVLCCIFVSPLTC